MKESEWNDNSPLHKLSKVLKIIAIVLLVFGIIGLAVLSTQSQLGVVLSFSEIQYNIYFGITIGGFFGLSIGQLIVDTIRLKNKLFTKGGK